MFTHLHVHSEYSLLDGHSRIPSLVARAKDLGMSALGLTDHGALYGAIDFYIACQQAGIKPILGCELYVAPGDRRTQRAGDKSPFHLTVLAKDNVGYRNLMQLVTKANLEGFYYKPRVDKELLSHHREGLIVLSGCPSGELGVLLQNGNYPAAEELVRWYKETFPHFYLEIQRHGNLDFQEHVNSRLLRLAERLNVPLVATNDLHYTEQSDASYQDVLLCIQTNAAVQEQNRMRFSDDSYYLKSAEEMSELFADLPEAVASTQEIADLADVRLDFSTLHLPEFGVPDGTDADSYLRQLCEAGFTRRFGALPSREARERLAYELDVISKTSYPNYFLVVWDIANFARQSDILLGVRGSAASSLVLYCLNVTEVNPLDHGLVFERFLNIERKELPDIDLDFQDDRRDEAIRYVVERYGHDHVAQIITFGTLGAKAAIRDVGRALSLAYADVDRIARLIPARLGVTIDTAMAESEELQQAYDQDPTYRHLIEVARVLEGTIRHASTHAAGVVISKDPLSERVPLQRPIKSNEQGATMTQYSMEPLAKLGLLKMDFLGLSNLTTLSMARNLVRERTGVNIPLHSIPFDDDRTFAMLASGETTGLFQLESIGMRRHIKELKPTSLGDLAAMVALYRPGPMEHIQRFIDSKHGRSAPEYPHPALREILEETYGVIVYQDQVLHILRTFAGYSLGAADIVRKAMGKKIPELMAQERERFIGGAIHKGYKRETAEAIFELIQPFAGYAFNKAHSVSYAVIAYWTAYFKANHPVEFMTALLNAYFGSTERVASIAAECARLNIPLLPPDVNRSGVRFTIASDPSRQPAIRFGLAAVKNVGAAALGGLMESRTREGPFETLEDFCRRAGEQIANRRTLESLVRVGALDALEQRGRLLAGLDQVVSLLHREAQRAKSNQSTMFDLFGKSVPVPLSGTDLPGATEPTGAEIGSWERDLLGVSFSGPTIRHLTQGVLPGTVLSRTQLEAESPGARVDIVGIVTSARLSYDREQRRFAFVTLGLLDGTVDVAVWARVYSETAELWQEGATIRLVGRVTTRRDELGLRCERAEPYVIQQSESASEHTRPAASPRVEEWPLQANPPANGTPGLPAMHGNAETHRIGGDLKGTGAGVTTTPSLNPVTAQLPPRDASLTDESSPTGPRRLLLNLTEGEHPEEDTLLLRELLAVLLEYPGNDRVDLIIQSQGMRYRVEMPIIATCYCDELRERIRSRVGTEDSLILLGPG